MYQPAKLLRLSDYSKLITGTNEDTEIHNTFCAHTKLVKLKSQSVSCTHRWACTYLCIARAPSYGKICTQKRVQKRSGEAVKCVNTSSCRRKLITKYTLLSEWELASASDAEPERSLSSYLWGESVSAPCWQTSHAGGAGGGCSHAILRPDSGQTMTRRLDRCAHEAAGVCVCVCVNVSGVWL